MLEGTFYLGLFATIFSVLLAVLVMTMILLMVFLTHKPRRRSDGSPRRSTGQSKG
jgi:uncharacterized membrane protein